MIAHPESGRAALSKGLLPMAKKVAIENVTIFSKLASQDVPLVGIEPSAILSFRDEYSRLVAPADRIKAKTLAKNTFTIEEFLANEIKQGRITSTLFSTTQKHILVHGHCHQKALSSVEHSAWILGLPENYSEKLFLRDVVVWRALLVMKKNIMISVCRLANWFCFQQFEQLKRRWLLLQQELVVGIK